MTDRFEKFTKIYNERFEKLKPLLNITIYGSWFPESEKKFLKDQRDFLRNSGYKETYIVEDYPEPSSDQTTLGKSIQCLEFSDVNFLIFTHKGKAQGVGRELTHIATSESMLGKIPFCVVFDEIKDGISAVSSLHHDDIDNTGITRREFTNEAQLRDRLLRLSSAKLRMLQNKLTKKL